MVSILKGATYGEKTYSFTVSGSGDITGFSQVATTPSVAWGTLLGSIDDQLDLKNALAGKEPNIAPGTSVQVWKGSKAWGAVDWTELTGKPSTFTPSTHSHTFASLTSKPTTLAGYGITDAASSTHSHDGTYAQAVHNHSSLYQPLDADLTAIAALTGAGTPVRNAGGGWTLQTGFTPTAHTHGPGDIGIAGGDAFMAFDQYGAGMAITPAQARTLLGGAAPEYNSGVSLDCVSFAYNGTPTNGYLITTNIDDSDWGMYLVEITGFAYGDATPFHLLISFYLNNNPGYWNVSQPKAVLLCDSAFDPGTITISRNDVSHKITIHLSANDYYMRFYVKAYENGTALASLRGWTVTDAAPMNWSPGMATAPIVRAITSSTIGSQSVANAATAPWSGISGKPTTIAGYGITDAITSANISTQTVANAGKLVNAHAYTNGTDGWWRSTGATGMYNATYSAGICATATQFLQTYNSSSFQVNGTLYATGNVVAYYSDERLKTDIAPVTGAVEKLEQIRAVTYRPNELGLGFGFEDRRQLGVIAQEVQKVAPEAVVSAPFDISRDEATFGQSISGENYLTVQYERLVPLLIAAVQEQAHEIRELKRRIG